MDKGKGQISFKHHFVPEFYLAGFTPSGSDSDKLIVWDLERGNTRPSKPSATGFEKRLYELNVKTLRPDAIEKFFAHIEGQAGPAIKSIHETLKLPDDESYGWLMALIGLQTTRIPAYRDALFKVAESQARGLLEKVLATPEAWDETVRRMKADGVEVKHIDYKEMRVVIDDPQALEIVFPHQLFLKHMLLSFHAAILPLCNRSWTLWVIEDNDDSFIASDCPVAVSWVVPRTRPPSLDDSRTILTFPLSRKLALEGRYEGRPRVERADRRIVAIINGHTAHFANNNLYSPFPDFVWSGLFEVKQHNGGEFLARATEARKKSEDPPKRP